MTDVVKKTEEKSSSGIDIEGTVDYVILETTRNDQVGLLSPTMDNHNLRIQRGLFLGISIKDDNVFYITTKKGNNVTLLNSKQFKISLIEFGSRSEIEFGSRSEKAILVFGKSDSDQKIAGLLLSELLAEYQKKHMVSEDINIVNFNNLRGYNIDRNTFNTSTVDKKPIGFTDNGYDAWNKGNGYYNKREATKTYYEEIKVFERKSKKPSKAKLNAMKTLVVAITANKGHGIGDIIESTTRKAVSVEAKATSGTTTETKKTIPPGMIECYGCDGTGEKVTGGLCLVCKGVGWISYEQPIDKDMDSDKWLRKCVAGDVGCPI